MPHQYRVSVRWTGNRGTGTSEYTAYGRDHVILAAGKSPVLGSADPSFRGERARYNPEELLVASLSACHMLSYLHLCASAGVGVEEYTDDADGTMEMGVNGSGRFTLVTLHPVVTIRAGPTLEASALHEEAHRRCFIANSVNFPVRCAPTVRVRDPSPAPPPRRSRSAAPR